MIESKRWEWLSAVAAMTILLAGDVQASNAQVGPGKFRIGAAIAGFTYSNVDVEGLDIETNQFSIGPGGDVRLGYAFTEVLEAGLNFRLDHVDVEVGNVDDDATSWRIGPYAEVNLPVNADGTALLAPGLSVTYSNLEGSGIDLEGVDIGVSGTLKYFVVANASVDVGLGFRYFIGDADGSGADVAADGFFIGPRLGISIWP